ncbi:hypothetical protein EBU95_21240, partial [bacterium]|nr:hypothetical protein [bacterium]
MFDRNKPNFVVNITGGAGKNLLFSGVCKNIKDTYPDHNLVVISPYPELLLNLPFIDRVYKMGMTPYMYEDIISTHPDNISNAIEPYNHHGYLSEKEHLMVTWSRALGVKAEFQPPEIAINQREMVDFQTRYAAQLGGSEKPILVIQPFGGGSPDQKYNWCRDLPLSQAQEIVDVVSKDFFVVQIGREDQIQLKNTLRFTGTLREIACLLVLSRKRILIDSFCQHCAAALRSPSTVCWVTNKPKVFGYEIHNNIQAPQGPNHRFVHHIDSSFQLENWTGTFNNYYPYN